MTVLKHLLSLILGFSSCFILLLSLLFGQQILYNSRTYSDKLFNSENWKSKKDVNERLQMIKDLEYFYISRGMSLGELNGLLGSPDLTSGDSIVSFSIGSPGIFASNQTLVFKANGKKLIEDFEIEK